MLALRVNLDVIPQVSSKRLLGLLRGRRLAVLLEFVNAHNALDVLALLLIKFIARVPDALEALLNLEFAAPHDVYGPRGLAFTRDNLPAHAFVHFEVVLEASQSGARPASEEGQVLKEVNKLVLVLDLYLLENLLVDVLAYHCEVAVRQALYGSCARLVVDESKLAKGGPGAHLDHFREEDSVELAQSCIVLLDGSRDDRRLKLPNALSVVISGGLPAELQALTHSRGLLHDQSIM